MMIRVSSLLLCFWVISSTHAAGICDGFIVKINNRLSEGLLITHIVTVNGELDPPMLSSIDAHKKAAFTMTKANKSDTIQGEMWLYSMQVPSKKITLKFTLEDKGIYCKHSDESSAEEHHPTSKRYFGWGVEYMIDY